MLVTDTSRWLAPTPRNMHVCLLFFFFFGQGLAKRRREVKRLNWANHCRHWYVIDTPHWERHTTPQNKTPAFGSCLKSRWVGEGGVMEEGGHVNDSRPNHSSDTQSWVLPQVPQLRSVITPEELRQNVLQCAPMISWRLWEEAHAISASTAPYVTRLPPSIRVVERRCGRGRAGPKWMTSASGALLLGCQPVNGRREAPTWPHIASPQWPRMGTGTTSNPP